MEHRWGERTGIEIPVALRTAAAQAFAGQIANASVSGAFIRTSAAQPFMARIDILIDGQTVPAFVVRIAPDGIGVEWCDLAPGMISALLLAQPVAPPVPAAFPARETASRSAAALAPR